MPKRRNQMRPSKAFLDSDQQAKKARAGEVGNEAYGLAVLLDSIPGCNPKNRSGLEVELARRLLNLRRRKDGSVLRELAAFFESPVASPARDVALQWVDEVNFRKSAHVPMPKRKDIAMDIMDRTGCHEKTAENAIAYSGLPTLCGWKAGRPRKS